MKYTIGFSIKQKGNGKYADFNIKFCSQEIEATNDDDFLEKIANDKSVMEHLDYGWKICSLEIIVSTSKWDLIEKIQTRRAEVQ